MTYPEDLVSPDLVKKHLRLASDYKAEDDLIAAYITQATAAVLNYIDRNDDDWTDEIEAWDDETVPPPVAAAIMQQAAELYRFRGDEAAPQREPGYMNPMIKALLMPYRDPSVA